MGPGTKAAGEAGHRGGPRSRWEKFTASALLWCLVAAILLSPVSRGDGREVCLQCGSTKDYWFLGYGVWGVWFRFWASEEVVPSKVLREFFPPGHVHPWTGDGGLVRGAFVVNTIITNGYRACGFRLPNSLVRECNGSDSTLALVRGKLESGETTREELIRICSIPESPHRARTVPPGTHALVRKANGWMDVKNGVRTGLPEPLWFPETPDRPWPPEEP